jgi:hypothetical protein
VIGNATGIPAPLTIARSGSNVVISWSSLLSGVALQQNATLNPQTWVTLPATNSINGTTNSIVVPFGADSMFYRLSE